MRSTGLASDAAGQPLPQVVDLEERAWLPRHCRGDAGAFPALLQAYRRPVFSYLVRAGVAEADRDDVFQSIFLKIHGAANTYQSAQPLAPWLFTIVANTVRNHFRGQPHPTPLSTLDGPIELADPDPSPERVAQARQTIAWLERAMAALPLAQREVLVMRTILEMRQQDVAEALDLPLNTVKTHLRRARLTLAKALAEREAPDDGAGETHENM